MRLLRLVIILAFSGLSPAVAFTRLTYLDDRLRFAHTEITDEITNDDVTRFSELVTMLRRMDIETIDVELKSKGGSVQAAIKIGEIVREHWLWTVVPDDSPTECSSACVLIFAAGAERMAGDGSRVGIHRPRFDAQMFAGKEPREAQALYGNRIADLFGTYGNG